MLLVTALLLLWGMITKSNKEIVFLDKNHTLLLKGMAMLIITLCHFGQALNISHIQFLAGTGVSIFLLVSGYGITKSYQVKGLTGYWRSRLVKVVLPYYLIHFFAWLMFGYEMSLTFILKTILFQESWFVMHIMIFYAFFYFCAVMKEKLNFSINRMLVLMVILSLAYFTIDSLHFYIPGAESLKARQMIPFVIGMILALKPSAYAKITKCNCVISIIMILFGTGLVYASEVIKSKIGIIIVSNFVAYFSVSSIALGTIALSFKFSRFLDNRFLEMIGLISYEMFLLQGPVIQIGFKIPEYTCSLFIALIGGAWFVNKVIGDMNATLLGANRNIGDI